MAFVRLSQGHLFRWFSFVFVWLTRMYCFVSCLVNISEVPLPVKFIFLLIGPPSDDYFEVGRSLGTLFSTPVRQQKENRRATMFKSNDFHVF